MSRHTTCSSITSSDNKKHIVRLFWPRQLLQRLQDHNIQACVLLGVVIHCKAVHDSKLSVAAVVDWCCHSLTQAQLSNTHNVSITVEDQHHVATLAAVGVWKSKLDAMPAARLPADVGAKTGLWLVLEGKLQCSDLLSNQQAGWDSRQRLQQLPRVCLDHSQLPSGTTAVQVKMNGHAGSLVEPAGSPIRSNLAMLGLQHIVS